MRSACTEAISRGSAWRSIWIRSSRSSRTGASIRRRNLGRIGARLTLGLDVDHIAAAAGDDDDLAAVAEEGRHCPAHHTDDQRPEHGRPESVYLEPFDQLRR